MQFTEPIFRAPQEAQSLLVRGSQGCTHNKCHFCYMSRGYRYGAATPEQFEEEVRQQKAAYPADTRVYVIGSDTLSLPFDNLRRYADILRKHLPGLEEISLQGRASGLQRKSPEQLKGLKEAGIKHFYIGMESGYEEALRIMNKGFTARETLEQLQRLDEAGLEYTAMYMLGMAGRGHGLASGVATAELLNQARPRRVTTTGLTVFSNAPLAEMVASGEFVEAPEKEKVEEMLTFLEHLEIDTIFDAVHYLSPLHYRFRTVEHKAEALAGLRQFLASHTEEEIENLVGRRHMHTL